MERYRIDVWGTKDGYRFDVLDGNGTKVYSGWGMSKAAARRMAQRWIDARPVPGTPVHPPSTGKH